jgi:hypothetical protein
MARRWRNYTNIPDDVAKAIYNAVLPPGLKAHDVEIKNSGGAGRGRAYIQGSGYHATARPFVVVCVPKTETAARRRWHEAGGRGGYLPMVIGSRLEALVMVMAHELRHLWQGKSKGKPRGMVYGAKGRYSERDADAYALQMLRRYRRGELLPVGPQK